MNWNTEQIELVESRLFLIKQLIEAKEHFRGKDKVIMLEDGTWTHSYKDYAALRVYLVLTCFDILGQPNSWIDFNSWLRSKKVKKEREDIIEETHSLNHSKFILAVNDEYNKIYGVKNSFYKFIREILTEENKNKLFDSIWTTVQLTPPIPTSTGTTLATGKPIELSIKKKEQFLYEIRNSFTHKGISIENEAGGVFEIEKPRVFFPDPTPKWTFSGIHKKTIDGDLITFSVRRWPFVLIEIIEDTISICKKEKEMSDRDKHRI